MTLKSLINEFINNRLSGEKFYSQICKVISINETERVCIVAPVSGDAERRVRLQASLSLSEGLFIKPAINSFVHVTFINNNTGVITHYSQIDEIEVKGNKITIKQGGEKIDNVFERVRDIQDDINTLKGVFKNWVVAPNDGGLALKTATTTWFSSDIEIIT